MSMYHVIVSQGENNRQEIFKSERFLHAKTAAENYKRDTGMNCRVESRVDCFTTSTLEEAIAEADALTAASRTMADRTAEHKAAGFTPGNMGTPTAAEWAADALKQGR